MVPYIQQTGVATILLNLATIALAAFVAKILLLPNEQRTAITLECGLQNSTLGLAVAITILGRTDISVPVAVYGSIDALHRLCLCNVGAFAGAGIKSGMASDEPKKASTIAARAGGFIDAGSGGVAPPLQPSTTFVRDENYNPVSPENVYGRDHNDQVRLAEDIICRLGGGQRGFAFCIRNCPPCRAFLII